MLSCPVVHLVHQLSDDVLQVSATETLVRHAQRWGLAVLLLVATAGALPQDFVVYNTLEDGELETRIRVGKITAKEVTVGRDLGLKFRQLSDGQNLIQLIYSSSSISDCDYVHDAVSVGDFLESFARDIHELTTVYNASVLALENGIMPQSMAKWMNYNKLKEECKKMHQEAKKALEDRKKENQMRNHTESVQSNRSRRSVKSSTSFLVMPGTLWCGGGDAASKYQNLGLLWGTDRCCRRHDYCTQNIPGFSQKYGLINTRPFTISSCWCDRSSSRSRRDISEYLRVPGTKWCGKGKSASKYTDVGIFSSTDRCCRRHDSACPFWIAGFDTKYGLFNWRVNTIMHCHCDERFRTCLKRVGTSDANLVGKLFFNVVQTKCFVFKSKKTCVQRSWWGKCQKKKRLKQAILRDNMPY